MKIGLVYLSKSSVGSGGAEHILCDMANAFVERGHRVFVFIDHPKRRIRPFYPLHKDVKLINIRHGFYRYLPRHFRALGRRVMMMYYTVRLTPDVFVCSFINDLRMLPKGEGFAKVLMQHSIPIVYFPHSRHRYHAFRQALQQTSFIQVLVPSFKPMLNLFYQTQIPIEVIANPAPVVKKPLSLTRKENKTVLWVGRISPEKQPDKLLKIWPTIHQKHPDWKLEIYGDDTHKEYAEFCHRLIREPSSMNVYFKGAVPDIMKRYRQADFIVVTSRFEGWSLAMTEAMSSGLPALGFKSTPGVCDLIQPGQNGLLCDENDVDLQQGILWLIEHPQERARMGIMAHKMVAPYAPERIWDIWEEKLQRAVRAAQDLRL